MKQALYWTPRVIGICIAGFVSIFAMDVFGEGYTFWETVTALLMHLVPTYVVVVALVLAWRWEWIGALLFIGLSVFYIVWVWGRFPWVTYLAISRGTGSGLGKRRQSRRCVVGESPIQGRISDPP